MIEPTGEMRLAFNEAPGADPDCACAICLNRRLAAVLAIVERDHQLVEVCTDELVPGLRCTRGVYGEPHRGDHESKTSTGNTVRWS